MGKNLLARPRTGQLPGAELLAEAPDRVQLGLELVGDGGQPAVRVVQTALDLPAVQPELVPVLAQFADHRLELAPQLRGRGLQLAGQVIDQRSGRPPDALAQGDRHVEHRGGHHQGGHGQHSFHYVLPGLRGQTSRVVIVTAAAARTRASTAATRMIQSRTDRPARTPAVSHTLTAPSAPALASLPPAPNATPLTPVPACTADPSPALAA